MQLMDQFSKSRAVRACLQRRHTKDIGLGGVRNFVSSGNQVHGSTSLAHLAFVACKSEIISSMDRCY